MESCSPNNHTPYILGDAPAVLTLTDPKTNQLIGTMQLCEKCRLVFWTKHEPKQEVKQEKPSEPPVITPPTKPKRKRTTKKK